MCRTGWSKKRHAVLTLALVVGLAALGNRAWAGTFPATDLNDLNVIKSNILAAQFLARATFGPTMTDITTLGTRIRQIGQRAACEEWIDQQVAKPVSEHWNTANNMLAAAGWDWQALGGIVDDYTRWREYAWWHIAITGEDQLRQRVAWALAQIFVVGDDADIFRTRDPLETASTSLNRPYWLGLCDYYDTVLVANAFGTYKQLLRDMTWHPCMGVWLSSVKNRKATTTYAPDENYAREVMQLFSIGLWELEKNGEYRRDANGNTIDTYDNNTITTLARVFTGFCYSNNNPVSVNFGTGTNLHQPMDMDPSYHDFTAKSAFKGALAIPARTANEANARQDVDDVLTYLADTHYNTSPFIAKALIQRLVRSNPSKTYVRRVARAYETSGGNFVTIIKAVLLDPEALVTSNMTQTRTPLALSVTSKGTEFTRLREPIVRHLAMLRAFTPTLTANGAPAGYMWIHNGLTKTYLGQGPYAMPSVFNFYLPDYAPAGLDGYVPSLQIPNGQMAAPEFEIMTGVQTNLTLNRYRQELVDSDMDSDMSIAPSSRKSPAVVMNLQPVVDLLGVSGEPTAAQLATMMRYLDLLLCHGTCSESTKQKIIDACTAEIASQDISSSTAKLNLVRGAVYALLTAPDVAVGD